MNELQYNKNLEVSITEAKIDPRGGELLVADYNSLDDDVVKDLKKILKNLGIFVYETPSSKGTDTWALVFSKNSMTSAQLKEFDM
jgi:hypothetical protein